MVLMQPISRIRSSDTCCELHSNGSSFVLPDIGASIIMSFAYTGQDARKIASILPSIIDAYDRCVHCHSSTASSADTTL